MRISYGSPSEECPTYDNQIFVGLKEDLLAALGDGGDVCNAILHRMVSEIKPTTDNPVTRTTTSVEESKSGDQLVTSSVVVLPTACSRHNAPSRAHSISRAVRQCAIGKSVLVVAVIPSADRALASVVAAAKAFSKFSKKSGPKSDRHVTIKSLCLDGSSVDYSAIANVAEGARDAAALVDMPTNILHSDAYIAYVRKHLDALPEAVRSLVHLEVFSGREDLMSRGLGGLWSVGQAAEHPPALVILTYTPATESEAPAVALVGKGIVYDTGGLSIKTKTGMPGMKRDMGGSAALLHAFLAAVQNAHTGRLACLLCIAENSVSSTATRPDDIITQYSGKTVEINNTDAEGRLVLGDGVAYAVRNLSPDILIDMATLTGAQGISTGKRHGALYCNSESLERLAISVGKSSGDLVHPLPYCPEFYRAEFKSVVADFKNSVANRANAQSSCAGQFIGNHIPSEFLRSNGWLHVDMAYPSFDGERGTGFGVALVSELLRVASTSGKRYTPDEE